MFNLHCGFRFNTCEHMRTHAIEFNKQICIGTTDLVYWSFQTAQGMDFLSRKGVLHGDLAARNILLASDNLIRISDFGFSRSLRCDEDYTKNTEVSKHRGIKTNHS